MERIKQSRNEPYHKFTIIGGELENIIQKKNHPSRAALIWQNAFFGEEKSKDVEIRQLSVSENAPFDMYELEPELFKKLKEYIKLPRRIVKAYNARLRDDSH